MFSNGCACGRSARNRAADQQRQRVFVLRHLAGVLLHTHARRLQLGLGAMHIELGHAAGALAAVDHLRGVFLHLERVLRNFQQFLIGPERQVGAGDLGHETDLCTTAHLLDGEVLLQRLVLRLRTRPNRSSSKALNPRRRPSALMIGSCPGGRRSPLMRELAKRGAAVDGRNCAARWMRYCARA